MIPPITIALVGCGKSKRSTPAAAKDLYTGPLFRAARAYAEECDEWRIVSAKYGILDPETVIEPYDARLPTRYAPTWARAVSATIAVEFHACGPYELLILAGADYSTPIREAMKRHDGSWLGECVGVREPLLGLGLGARLRWFAHTWRDRIHAPYPDQGGGHDAKSG